MNPGVERRPAWGTERRGCHSGSGSGDKPNFTASQRQFRAALAQEVHKMREGEAGLDMLPEARKVWQLPRWADIVAARLTVRTCSCRRCSTCTRQAAAARNRARYGQDDYPGAGHAR